MRKLATGEGWDFVLIGSDVYRVSANWKPDADGHPMGKRWECSFEHWNRYRQVYSWAK